MTLKAGMRQLAAALRGSFEGTAAIHHAGAKGEGREEALAQALRPFIPKRFDLSSGEVVNSQGGRSGQQDLIVSDSYLGTPFISQGRIGIHPIESVVATIQVKSRIDPDEARSGVANLSSVKGLLPDVARGFTRISGGQISLGESRMKPFGGLVAYTLHGSWQATARAYGAANLEVAPVDRTSVLLVLDEFAMCWLAEDGVSIVTDPSVARSARVFRAGADSILFFYILMMEALRAYQPPPLDLTAYFGASGISWEQFDVQLGGTK